MRMDNQRMLRLAMIGIGLIIGSLLLRVGINWFFDNFERATRVERSGFLPEARKNPLLAAERYLKSIGTDVKSINTTDLWRNLPSPGDTIIIYRYSPPAGELRRQALHNWVKQGGRLFVKADDSILVTTDMSGRKRVPRADENGLLFELGISLKQHDADFYTKQLINKGPAEVKFSSFKDKVLVHFNTHRYLQIDENKASPKEAVPCGKGYCLLQYEFGKGLVTVTSDISFINNYNIDEHDHALALALLRADPPMQTWLVYDVDMPSLLELIWKYAPQAVSALLVALLLWLWQRGARLGPLLPSLQQPRRSIDEHLRACAGFLWRVDRGKQLFIDNQHNLKQAWFSKHFMLRSMASRDSCAWIGARAGLSPEAVQRALYGTFSSEQDFVELSSYLQILRMAL
ncbi:MAG: DUF4350 domain-containing protein [Gammaproteobacteria bacterium]